MATFYDDDEFVRQRLEQVLSSTRTIPQEQILAVIAEQANIQDLIPLEKWNHLVAECQQTLPANIVEQDILFYIEWGMLSVLDHSMTTVQYILPHVRRVILKWFEDRKE